MPWWHWQAGCVLGEVDESAPAGQMHGYLGMHKRWETVEAGHACGISRPLAQLAGVATLGDLMQRVP